jgi:DNA-binding transcriptional MerR regulator
MENPEERLPDRVLSMSGMARRLDVPEQRLRYRARQGDIPFIVDDVGRRTFRESDIPTLREALSPRRRPA